MRLRPLFYQRWLSGNIYLPADAPREVKRNGRRVRAALARAARRSGQVWHVNSFYRSIAEQTQLHDAYLAGRGPLAALPGHSNHNFAKAMDVSDKFGRPVGQTVGCRDALKREGLCLPVPGERWHVELGTYWSPGN